MTAFDIDIQHWPTISAFVAYLRGVPRPIWCTGITNHNTYIPNESQWRGLASMRSMEQTYVAKGWSAGPHLYLCAAAPDPADTGVWQMTPLAHPGVHAGACNAHHLGIENVGDFNARPPTADQYTLLLAVNRAILETWGLPPESVVVHNECMTGRTCPGKYLTGTQIRASLRIQWPAPPSPTPARITPDSLLLWEPRATPAQCVAWLTRGATGEYTRADVQAIVTMYYQHATGIDPLLAIAQMAHETGNLTSWWAARPRRNPAGLGVTGVKGEGLAFASWDLAVRAHIGRLLAYALPPKSGTPAQAERIADALALRPLPLAYRGTAERLSGLNGRWAAPGWDYATKIAEIANAIVAGLGVGHASNE